MLKIATHNSCTGESGKGILSWLVTLFARCQSKTIREQFEAGTRFFDIRALLCKDGQYHPAHGLWTCKRTITDVLQKLNLLALMDTENTTYVTITYEHPNDYPAPFITAVHEWQKKYPHLQFVEVAVKLPDWRVLETICDVPYEYGFKPINKYTKRQLFPIPIFYWLINKKATFNEEQFTMVDFL